MANPYFYEFTSGLENLFAEEDFSGEGHGSYPKLKGVEYHYTIEDAIKKWCRCASVFLWDHGTHSFVVVQTPEFIELPGGRAMNHESSWGAALRELHEETGISKATLKHFDARFAFAVSIPVTKGRTMMIYVLVIPHYAQEIVFSRKKSKGEVNHVTWCHTAISDAPTFWTPNRWKHKLCKPFRHGDVHVFCLLDYSLDQADYVNPNYPCLLPRIK